MLNLGNKVDKQVSNVSLLDSCDDGACDTKLVNAKKHSFHLTLA